METTKKISYNVGEVSDPKREEVEVEGDAGEDVAKECLLKAVVKLGAKEKIENPMYEGNLDVEELMD
jgi:hypothetical protein